MIAPSADQENSVVLLKNESIKLTEFKKNILKKSIDRFITVLNINPFLEDFMKYVSFENAPMPTKLHKLPCGLYEWILPDWMKTVCDRALQVNPDCNKGDCVLGWNYKGKMTTYSFGDSTVPEPFRERIWFDPDRKLKSVSMEKYWESLYQAFPMRDVMILKLLLSE